MLKKKPLSLAIVSSLAAASCQWMIASDVYAASTNTKSADSQPMEEVVVTGSRIRNPNVVSASPITQITSRQIALQGTVRVEDMLANMPQIGEEQGTGQSNGSTGTATLNLRNLGTNRTLVLVNGKRLPVGSPLQSGGADINQIPASLIKNVQILTGGASATYGSDAVAGVVNFIMKDDFEGVQFDGQYSLYQHDNRDSTMQNIIQTAGFNVPNGNTSGGNMNDFSLIMGGNLDSGKGNVTAYVTYRKIQAVTQATRDYSGCALNTAGTVCGGSSTVPWLRVSSFGITGWDPVDFTLLGGNGSEFMPWSTNGKLYNYGPLNYFQRPDTRYTAGVFAHYDVTDKVQAYMSIMGMDDHTVSQIAPSGNFFVTNTISCGNPFLSAQEFQQLCGQFGKTTADVQNAYMGRRNVEGGDRQQDLRHTSFRGVFGLRGNINDTWRYDVYGQYAEVIMSNTYYNDLGTTKIKRALDAVVDPSTGNIVCQSVLDGSDPTCVPWNVFTAGAVTPAMTNYLSLPLFARGTTSQQVWSGYVAGNLGDYGWKLPSANQGINLVAGAEYRLEGLDFNPDQNFINGEGAGQGGGTEPVHGSYEVKEFFLESSIPIVQGAAFAQDITLDVGYRHSDYKVDAVGSPSHKINTYGIRGAWQFNNSVKLRASFQRAIRAANITELFLPQGFNLFDMNADPCGGATPAATLAQCANSGVTAAQYGSISNSPAGQYNFLQGGNPNVAPEKADTYSVGLVVTPEMVPGLSMSVDYYNIKIEDGINNLDPEFILNQCVFGNQLCNYVKRGASGDLWLGSNPTTSGHVVALVDNLSVEKVQGVDINADYTLDLGDKGSLVFNDVMGILNKWDTQQLATAAPEHCKGAWNSTCGYPTPDFRNVFHATWNTPWNVSATLSWRHISKVKDLTGNVDLSARNYIDLAGTWNVNDSMTFMLGANNLFDKAPPIAGGGAGPSLYGNGNIFPGLYDALGRYIFARVQLRH